MLLTNVCVMCLNGHLTWVRDRLLSVPLGDMAVCSVVKAELFYGALRSNNPTRTLERQQDFLRRFASLPFGDEAAIMCGQIQESEDLREKVMTAIDRGELPITN